MHAHERRWLEAEAGTLGACLDNKISGGGVHTCSILDNAELKCWGLNNRGQLGYDSTDDKGDEAGEMASLAAVNLGAGRTAVAVSAGEERDEGVAVAARRRVGAGVGSSEGRGVGAGGVGDGGVGRGVGRVVGRGAGGAVGDPGAAEGPRVGPAVGAGDGAGAVGAAVGPQKPQVARQVPSKGAPPAKSVSQSPSAAAAAQHARASA